LKPLDVVLVALLWEVVVHECLERAKRKGAIIMQQPDLPAESIFLNCGCGEKMVILGRVEDWLPRNPVFRCNCGEKVIFSDNAKEEYWASLKAS
jgi:hypothetical protein